MTHAVRHQISRIIMPVLRRAAQSYIAGPELNDALIVAQTLREKGSTTTIAFWDESGATSASVLAAYKQSLQALPNAAPDSYISVKAPSVENSRQAFAQLIELCRPFSTRLHFDSLAHDSAAPIRALVESLLPQYSHLSYTLPGRWIRSLEDADWAIQRKIAVRVVKGQWEDPTAPRRDPHQGYLEVIERLAGRAAFVAVATHNPDLARPALERLLKTGTPCELEMLYGLPRKSVMNVAASLGVRTRIYVPYGYGWLPYSLSQARRNPKIFWWMLKDAMLRPSPAKAAHHAKA